MANNTIQIVIKADGSSAVSGIKDVTNSLSNIGKTAGIAAVAGIGAATVAVAGFGAAGLKAFVGFEQGMNEVFTLLPGISEDAMADMTGQVKDFAKEFGTLPEEVVPALYQALSAGVPPGNVFDFLEQANKAAVGGVSTLDAAVSGISSVVNAYGAEILSAEQASDLMFTTVKLGVTTFDELSGSLGNVTPYSSALGVEFGNVTAALATMTTQGLSTGQATTGLRQMFVELSDSGSEVGKAFTELSGKTFKEFIAEGGNLQEALQVIAGGFTTMESSGGMSADAIEKTKNKIIDLKGKLVVATQKQSEWNDKTKESTKIASANTIDKLNRDIQALESSLTSTSWTTSSSTKTLQELFGSVEAGSAALILTGNGAESFTSNLEQMGASAGATDAAFETMDKGLGRTFEKIKAAASVFLIDIGERIAPTFAKFADMAILAFGPLSDFVLRVFDKITPILDNFTSYIGNLIDAFQTGGTAGLMDALGLSPAAVELIGKITGDLQWLANTISSQAGPVIAWLSSTIMPALNMAIEFVNQHWEAFRNALIAIIAVIAGATIFTTIAALIATIANPVTLVIAAVGLLAAAWTENWGGIRDILTQFWFNTALPVLTDLWAWLSVNVPIAIAALSNFWTTVLVPAMQAVWAFIQTSVIPAIATLWGWLATNVPVAIAALSDFWTGTLLPAIKDVWAFINTSVIPILKTVADWVGVNVPAAITVLTNFWNNTLLPALKVIWDFISNYLIPLFTSIATLITTVVAVAVEVLAGVFKNSLMPAISTVWTFLETYLKPAFNAVKEVMGTVASAITTVLQPAFNALGEFFSNVFQQKIGGIVSAFDAIKSAISGIIDFIGRLIDAINKIPDIPGVGGSSANRVFGSGAMSAGGIFGGSVGGLSSGSVNNSNSSVTNFNMTVNTQASASTVIQDFQTMRAMLA